MLRLKQVSCRWTTSVIQCNDNDYYFNSDINILPGNNPHMTISNDDGKHF
jgi:hypothetical protein